MEEIENKVFEARRAAFLEAAEIIRGESENSDWYYGGVLLAELLEQKARQVNMSHDSKGI